jgi:hypothetical protein
MSLEKYVMDQLESNGSVFWIVNVEDAFTIVRNDANTSTKNNILGQFDSVIPFIKEEETWFSLSFADIKFTTAIHRKPVFSTVMLPWLGSLLRG